MYSRRYTGTTFCISILAHGTRISASNLLLENFYLHMKQGFFRARKIVIVYRVMCLNEKQFAQSPWLSCLTIKHCSVCITFRHNQYEWKEMEEMYFFVWSRWGWEIYPRASFSKAARRQASSPLKLHCALDLFRWITYTFKL